ncbi:MAG: hypothetical protein KGZ74_08885 [Chitinophagaceae bacterium]|jgi:hypothetical protein|nr:hypothetical protein [Chitinophagaceae bacterium]
METTIRINTDHLNNDVIEAIRKMFPHKIVEITIQPADETDYITSNPAYASELQERIEEYKTKQNGIILKEDELL